MVRKRQVSGELEINQYLNEIVVALDLNKFGEVYHNLDVADTGLANTEFTITHNLRKVPQGWLMKYQDVAGSLYLVSWTASNATFKFSGANASIKFRLF